MGAGERQARPNQAEAVQMEGQGSRKALPRIRLIGRGHPGCGGGMGGPSIKRGAASQRGEALGGM